MPDSKLVAGRPRDTGAIDEGTDVGGADAAMAVSAVVSTASASAVGQVPLPNFTARPCPVHGSCALRLVKRSGRPRGGSLSHAVIPVDCSDVYGLIED